MHRTGHVRGRGGPLVVAGVSGGVGASTLAALLAQERSRAGRVVLMDLGAGGGLDVLLGLERVPGARWPDLDGLHGAVAPQDLDGLLPRWRSVEVLSASRHGAPPGVDAVAEVVDAFRGAGAFVVVDAAQRGGTRREVAARVAGELLLV
ncbi:MAG TPA: pilus assembly protein FlpE, partial [Actinotalea sp.]|nr:pilus assembly protein FlpE [Actinotalea sp.]